MTGPIAYPPSERLRIIRKYPSFLLARLPLRRKSIRNYSREIGNLGAIELADRIRVAACDLCRRRKAIVPMAIVLDDLALARRRLEGLAQSVNVLRDALLRLAEISPMYAEISPVMRAELEQGMELALRECDAAIAKEDNGPWANDFAGNAYAERAVRQPRRNGPREASGVRLASRSSEFLDQDFA